MVSIYYFIILSESPKYQFNYLIIKLLHFKLFVLRTECKNTIFIYCFNLYVLKIIRNFMQFKTILD